MKLVKKRAQKEDLEPQELVKIRPDLNLEKWTIWQPSKSTGKPKPRIIQRETTLPDGSTRTAKVEVGFTHKGALTTQDQKTLYALVKIWEEKGKSITYTPFSLRQLAQTLGMSWGTKNMQVLRNSLERLLITPFLWEHSYYNAEAKTLDRTQESPFTILVERKLSTREQDGHITKDEGYFRFHPLIVKNLHANYTKPVLFEVVISFKSEIAQLLYTQIDLFLANKPCYERRTKELFEDLGLTAASYKYASKRKQMLQPALQELLGKPLSNGGVIAKATLEPAKTVSDYKAVFEKRAQVTESVVAPEPARPSATPPLLAVLDAHTTKLITGLKSLGVSEAKAAALVKSHNQAVETWLIAFPYVDPKPAKNPAGWLVTAITAGYDLPPAYLQAEKEKLAQAQADARQRAEAGQRRLEYEQRKAREQAHTVLQALPEAQREALLEQYRAKLATQPKWQELLAKASHPALLRTTTSTLLAAARAALLADIMSGKLAL